MSLLENYHSDLSNLILCFVLVSQLSDSFPHCGLYPTRLPCQWDSLGKNTGVGCQFLLQELFLTYGLNPGLPHCPTLPTLLPQYSHIVSHSTCSVGDLGSIPGLGRFPREGKGYPLQYSGLENSMDCRVSPWSHKELDKSEQLSLSVFSL